jgi:hypothetical protein
MARISRCVISASLVAMAMSVRMAAEPQVALAVRLYNGSGAPAEELFAARRAIESTFHDAGLDVIVRHCGRQLPERSIDPCSEPLEPLEVVVRIIDAPHFNPTLHPDACGMAYVLREIDRGWLATAFFDRISSASARVGVDAGTLLGLVIAHELGHLMLGSGYHGGAGVMRAEWEEEQLLTHNPDAWRFSTLEAARLRRAATIPF